METLEFHLGGLEKPFTIPPWSYSFSGDNLNMPACVIGVSYMSTDFGVTILGDSFLREYVTSYNYKENTITLAKNIKAPKQTIPSRKSDFVWFSFSVGVIIGAVIFFLFYVKNGQRNRMKQ